MLEAISYSAGPLKTNCYFIKDENTGASAIIDIPAVIGELDQKIKNLKYGRVEYIFLTHGHFDHITEADRYRRLTGAKIAIGADELEFTSDSRLNLSERFMRDKIKSFSPDVLLYDGQIVNLGDSEIKIMSTPGHTRGGVCYISGNVIFSGDTVMKDVTGRTDFITGSSYELSISIKKFLSLEGDYIIYPGHGEKTTLENEKKNNEGFKKGLK